MFDCDFINMFGAGTEAGLQTLLTPEDHHRALDGKEHLLGSIGKPAFGVDIRIVDDDMNDVPVGEIGEIVSRSDAVMAGYLDEPERTAGAISDGWFRGGDLAWMDDEGYLYLSGRRHDMIIRGGENVYPVEIESVLAELAQVIEVAVVGVPDEHWGETVRAHVVVAHPDEFDPVAAAEYCRQRLAAYKVPTQFVVETALPKNASGKILKRELRHVAVRSSDTPRCDWPSDQQLYISVDVDYHGLATSERSQSVTGLRFGVFIAPYHSVYDNPTLSMRRDLELADRVDELGYDEVWFGEHHSAGSEIIGSPELFIAAAAERTKRIMLGTGVSSLAYHHPFMLADRFVQLDHMSFGPSCSDAARVRSRATPT